MNEVIKICCPDMEEKRRGYKKPPKFCPDCGNEVEMILEVKPITTFEEWWAKQKETEDRIVDYWTSADMCVDMKAPCQTAWKAGKEQFILYCYKMLTDDEEDGSGYLCDEILSKGKKILKGEKIE